MSPAPFQHPVRVFRYDTAAACVVFHANDLKYFKRARTEWLRSLDVQQQALRETTGAIFVVSDTQPRYPAPARLDDELRATVQPLHLGLWAGLPCHWPSGPGAACGCWPKATYASAAWTSKRSNPGAFPAR